MVRPAYITSTLLQMPATTPRSWVIMMMAVLNSRFSSLSNVMICAWTVTSSAVVGSSAISSFGRHSSAMAIITRWRMPPENSCGYMRMRLRASGIFTASSMRTDSSKASLLLIFLCSISTSISCSPTRI
ncbi:Protein of uncharacterised function (DUF1602) [Acinetobacter baumannii]|nr:Protein of uncharacterised function (DUF1602) [Acinetobacter baumannii]